MDQNEKTQVQTATRQIVKKITAKIVLGGKPSIEKLIRFNDANGKDAVMPLFRVIGLASDFTTGTSDFGAFVKLLGQFKAVNDETGEVFRSGAMILPGSGNDMVYGALRGLGDQGGQVEFAFKVGLKRDDTSATGYVYVVEQVYQEGQADALTALELRLGPPPAVARLAAPAANDAPPAAKTAAKK